MKAVVVGGGHAGLVASWHLQQLGIEHVVLEAGRIGESWRSQRWTSFALNTPTWMNRLPDDGDDPEPQDGFLLRDAWIARLETWARRHALPVREGVRVTSVRRTQDGAFQVATDAADPGSLSVPAVVVASGMQRVPKHPSAAASVPAGIASIHTAEYRDPGSLPPGGVIVVGSAQSGGQIAEELLLAGRRVIIAASPAPRQRRRYRGEDTLVWLRLAGLLDQTVDQLPDPRMRFAPPPIISGLGRHGHTLSLQGLAARGAVLTGRLTGLEDGRARFADDLAASIRRGDAVSAELRVAFDRAIAASGADAPPEPDDADPDDVPVSDPDAWAAAAPRELDLAAEGITGIVWATGFGPDIGWLDAGCLDPDQAPPATGVAGAVAGLWFLGVPWQRSRVSAVVFGADRDGAVVAGELAAYVRGEAARA